MCDHTISSFSSFSSFTQRQQKQHPGPIWGQCDLPYKEPEGDSSRETLPNNLACNARSDQCSKKMGDVFFDLCAFHTFLMARPEKFSCGCGSQFYVLNGPSEARFVFWRYYQTANSPYRCITPDDILVADFSGIFCCEVSQSLGETPYSCGEMNVGTCCADLHLGCVPDDSLYVDDYEQLK